jgi:lipopolysaccharide transport system permease protein
LTAKRHLVIEPNNRSFDLQLADIWQYRSLLMMLAWREITVRYQQTLLGILWVIVQPIVNIIIYGTVFGLLLHAPSENYPYVIYLFPALIIWRLIGDGISRGSLSLINNARLIEKIYFPRLVIVISVVSANLVDFLFALLVLLVTMVIYRVGLTWHILLLPVFVLLAVVIILTVCVWLAPLNIRYRDVTHILPFIVQISMYLSPIMYPITLLPEKVRGIYSLNPITTVVMGFRWCLLPNSVPPDPIPATIGFVITVIILVFGLAFFKRSERTFVDNI